MTGSLDPYVSELAETQLSQCGDDFAADFVGDIELHHAHVRRAEGGILLRSHGDGGFDRQMLFARWCIAWSAEGCLAVT